MRRREFLAAALVAAGCRVCLPAFAASSSEPPRWQPRGLTHLGRLSTPDANGLRLPRGFRSRIVARSGVRPVAHRDFLWHASPDGGAVFASPDGGWIYVSNAELTRNRGGASALRFAADGQLVDAYPVLGGTTLNCAGGPTPWGTWLSCEEYEQGLVWECDPYGVKPARSWPLLGAFTHEAVAIDPRTLRAYLTEDLPDGRWYRFTPGRVDGAGRPDLATGTLEVAAVGLGRNASVRWHAIVDPAGATTPTRNQAPGTRFDGGEGCWYANGAVYFTTKGDGRVWAYDIESERLRVIYDSTQVMKPILEGLDNVVAAGTGDILVAEDGGDMQIVAIAPNGRVAPVVQVVGHPTSEVAGPAFDPSGTRLYFSSQRGASGRERDGVTYEVSGPFGGT